MLHLPITLLVAPASFGYELFRHEAVAILVLVAAPVLALAWWRLSSIRPPVAGRGVPVGTARAATIVCLVGLTLTAAAAIGTWRDPPLHPECSLVGACVNGVPVGSPLVSPR